jgi:hypothetical protein
MSGKLLRLQPSCGKVRTLFTGFPQVCIAQNNYLLRATKLFSTVSTDTTTTNYILVIFPSK